MSAPVKVAIRADAGPSIGTGHFARVAAVADILSATGEAELLVITNTEGAALIPAFFPPDTTVVSLAQDDCGPKGAMRALDELDWSPEVVILDHYGSVPEWEALAADRNVQLVVFDDLDAAARADVIVRPHGGPESKSKNNIVLRGPAYLPLSRHVTDLAQSRSPDDAPRLKVNICFGGSDPTNETAKALQAVGDLDELDVDVVVGPGAKIDPPLIAAAEQLPHVSIHRAPGQEQLAKLMFEADLAVGAGGVMLWERLCLRVPSIVIAVAENQKQQINTMIKVGAIRFLGDHDQATSEKIAQAISALAADEQGRQTISEIGQKLTDGRGAKRIASWIRALALDIRQVTMDDANDLFTWRTDDRNWQHNFGTDQKPDFDAHISWLKTKLADPNCVFRIVERQNQPVGVVRFDIDNNDNSAYLSIYLVPEWHGRKMGLPVFSAAERELRQCRPSVEKIVSRIHSANKASERLHRDAGFEVAASAERADWLDAWKLLD